MLIFFYGPDSFRINKKVNEIKDKYTLANPDAFDIIDTPSSDISPKNIQTQILAMPLFSKTRLIIYRDFLSEAEEGCHEEFINLIDTIPNSTNVIITEPFPDKRLKIYKILIKKAKTQEFNFLDTKTLTTWIESSITEVKIERAGSMFLANNLIGNLWHINNILQKLETALLNYPEKEKIITLEQIKNEVEKINVNNSFDFVDSYLQKNQTRSLIILKQLLDGGENPFYLLSMLSGGVRNLILIKDASQKNMKSIAEISSYTMLKPFVISKNLSLTKNYLMDDLLKIHERILEADTLVKHGIIKPELALELLVFNGIKSDFTDKIIQFV